MPNPSDAPKILLVEDDRDFGQSLADILELNGFASRIACNLAEARVALADDDFPVVVSDMRLGRENGLDLLDHIREQQLPCRFLVLTAYADTQMAIEALQKGASDFLRKPLEIPQLLASLKRTFELLAFERERVAAEEAQRHHAQELAESEASFRALFEASPDGIIVSELESGTIIDVNDVVVRRTGIAKERLLGKDSLAAGLWEEADRTRLYAVLKVEGQVENQEVRYRQLERDVPVIGLLSARIIELKGRRCLLTTVRDVSALKAAEREREQAHQLTKVLIESLPGLFFMLDEEGKLVRWNRNYNEFLGYSDEELLNRDSLLRNPESEHGKLRAAIAEAFERGSATVESSAVSKSGEVRPYFYSGKRLELDGERYIVGVGIDISDRVAIEAALRESEEEYRKLYREFQAVLDGIPDALLLLDPQLQVVWANKGAEQHFGAQVGRLPGRQCQEIWGHGPEVCEECIRKTFAEGLPQEKMHTSGDGRVWGMKAFPIKDLGGQVNNVIQISSDLTEKIALREQADRASRLAALGEMAAGVAHEINNPNGMILINLGMVAQALAEGRVILDKHYAEQGDFPWGGIKYSRMRDEIPRLLEEMRDAAQRIKRTVEELKGFSRREPLSEYRQVDINTCVQNALRLTRSDQERVAATLRQALADGLPRVLCVPQRIEQILVNLISNACHAMTREERVLSLATRLDPEKGMVQVVVSDSGVGIPAEHLGRLTDPFFTTRRAEGGTGLGLSLSARMAKEHGGSLDFASRPGEGTTAILSLPAKGSGRP